MSEEDNERRNPNSTLDRLFDILRDPTSNNDIGTLQEDDNNVHNDNTAADGAIGTGGGVITVQQQTTTAKDSIEKNSDDWVLLEPDDVEEAELGRQWGELLKSSLGLLQCEVRLYGDLALIDLAKLAIDYEVPRDHNSNDWMYQYRPYIIKCLEDEYCNNRANICVDLLNKEEVHRKLIPKVISKSSKDGDLLSVFYSLRSTLGCINSIYRVPSQPTHEDVDTSIETSIADASSTSTLDTEEEDIQFDSGGNDTDTSFEDAVNNGGDDENVSITSDIDIQYNDAVGNGNVGQQLEDYSEVIQSYEIEECLSHLNTNEFECHCYPFTATITNGRPNQFQLGYNDKGVLHISRSAEIKPFDRRMLESLKDIVKQTGERMLTIVENANLFLDPSCPYFDVIPRNFEKDATRELSVYGKFVLVEGVWILDKVGAASDLLDRSTADEYEECIIRCLIHVDGIPAGDAYDGIAAELDKMIDWILDPANKVEEPVRRLFLVLKESGALSYSFGRQMIAQLLETAVTYRMREHQIEINGKSSLSALNEFAYYPLKMYQGMIKEVQIAMEAIMNHPQLIDLFDNPNPCAWRLIAMLNWKVGGRDDKLSSHKVGTEAAGFAYIGDFLPARFPDTNDVRLMYNDDYTETELNAGRNNAIAYLHMLLQCALRREYVFGLFNFYAKLFTWSQLQKLILSLHERESTSTEGFVEVTQVFNNPSSTGGSLPSELVLFRLGTVLIGVNKSTSSVADSSGRIKPHQCCQTGQAIDFCKNLADALEGKYSPSRVDSVGIEAAIAKTWSDENVHRHQMVSAALSRQFALRGTANAFTSSGLSNHNIYLRQARDIDTGIHCSQYQWYLSCIFSNGKTNLDDCVANVASFCGYSCSRWERALNHFRANDIVFAGLQRLLEVNKILYCVKYTDKRIRLHIDTTFISLTLEQHQALVNIQKKEYDTKKEVLIARKNKKRDTPEEKREIHEAVQKRAFDITLVRGFEFRDASKLGITPQQAQDGSMFFGYVTPDSQADHAGIISGDVPLVNGKPIEYNTFLAMAAKRPLAFDVKRYAYQQFYDKSSPAYIHPEALLLFNVGELKEMMKTMIGFDDKVDKMKRSELLSTLGKMIEERLEEDLENKKMQHDVAENKKMQLDVAEDKKRQATFIPEYILPKNLQRNVYDEKSLTDIAPQDLSLFNVGALKKMLKKAKKGFDDKTVDKMKRPELVSTLSTLCTINT